MLKEEKTVTAEVLAGKPEILRLLPPEPGEVLDGRFLILELLNQGGTSRVFKATDLERGDLVALKVPKEHFAQDPEYMERFRKEEEIGLRACHRYLVSMRPAPGRTRPYLVMEYLKGESLAHWLSAGHRLSVSEATRIAMMVLAALEELHRHGVVHRDVTPQNVMLCQDGTVRLMDYGISGRKKEGGAEEWTWGTPAYMAPEQVRNEPGDARTDLYGLGVVLYEMLTGCVPFVGDDPAQVMNARLTEAPVALRTLRPELDPELERIVLRALSKDPKDRYRNARSMRAVLESFALKGLNRSARIRRRGNWKGWLGKYWAEVVAMVLLGALIARISLALSSLSP